MDLKLLCLWVTRQRRPKFFFFSSSFFATLSLSQRLSKAKLAENLLTCSCLVPSESFSLSLRSTGIEF